MARSCSPRAIPRSPPRSASSSRRSAPSSTRGSGPRSRPRRRGDGAKRRSCGPSRRSRATPSASSSSRPRPAAGSVSSMLLALSATAIVVVALLWEVAWPKVTEAYERHRARRVRVADPAHGYYPCRERRAEQKARALLRSCVNSEEWAMYRDLGFIRVAGRLRPSDPATGEPAYAYLVSPHKPIVAYVPKTRRLLSEYCVEFPDLTRAISHS